MRLFLEPKENYILLWNNSIAKPQEEKPMSAQKSAQKRCSVGPAAPLHLPRRGSATHLHH